MMVNSHLKTQQTKATAGLEGLQAASPSTAGPSPGRPSTAGIPRGKVGARLRSRGVWPGEAGTSATAPPSGLKEESVSPSRRSGDKGPTPESAKKAGRGSGPERSGARPAEPGGSLPDFRDRFTPGHRRAPLLAGPCLGPLRPVEIPGLSTVPRFL